MSEDIHDDPVLRPMAEPFQDDPDYQDPDYSEKPSYPAAVRAAGVIWIVLGCLILANG